MIEAPLTQNRSPETFYTQRLRTCTEEASRRRQQHMRFGYVRLGWAVLLVALGWLVFARHTIAWPWLLVPWVGFAITAYFHGRVVAAGARSQRAMRWYEVGLARTGDRWSGLRPRQTRIDATGSLYAHDLDLFSPGGLFELLCTARTTPGEDTLANWLLQPASPERVRARQEAVAELRDHHELREALATLPGADVLRLDTEALRRWVGSFSTALPNALRWAAPMLALLTVLAALRWYIGHTPVLFALAIVLDGALTLWCQRRLRTLFAGVGEAAATLAGFAELLAVLERARFTAPLLAAAHAELLRDGAASGAVRQLATLARATALSGNVLLRPLGIPLLFGVQVGVRVQVWKQRYAARLPVWFEAVGELETLLSLSAYAFEHPGDPFPTLELESSRFEAEELGHPLLAAAGCVSNDVRLDAETRLLLISGSNMSGKSTLLRAVGVAAVMAMAGAPVRARVLRLSSFHVAASMQVNDSLQSGRSHFYAEILRLRAVCQKAQEQPPVLFLLDELLAGTNSQDRLAGASGVIRALLAAGACGLLSTHDLALTTLDGEEQSVIQNAHFEDTVVDGRLAFDYTLRPGVVQRSNGVALMRMIGLEV